jgi:hypothetical protein
VSATYIKLVFQLQFSLLEGAASVRRNIKTAPPTIKPNATQYKSARQVLNDMSSHFVDGPGG